MKKLFKFLFTLLIIYSLAACVFFVYGFIDGDESNNGEFDFYKPAKVICDYVLGVPEHTNFLILGTDEDGTRTDTIIVGSYDKSDNAVNLVSIPRDTIVSVSDSEFKMMNEEYPEPASSVMKLNQVYHFAGESYGIPMVVSNVERIIGSEIDYYCLVDFDALSFVIDEIGGVEFYVPCDMYYVDPYQDLYIELYEGWQILDGDSAEQLLRFRSGYDNADLGRVSVQQDFMKAFIEQTIAKENIIKNISSYFKAFTEYVETDLPVSKAVKYAVSAKDMTSDNIFTYTAPGYADFVDGISGYVIDDEEELFYSIFE